MKKASSILFAMLILLSGMHLSFAKHLCGGEVVSVKWSLVNEKATCGMESDASDCSKEKGIKSNCCQNEISQFTVDQNYQTSSFHVKEFSLKLIQLFATHESSFFHATSYPLISYTNIGPPDKKIANAVSLVDICVFRI